MKAFVFQFSRGRFSMAIEQQIPDENSITLR